jgi:Transcriptional regulator, AbiEi antitoxin
MTPRRRAGIPEIAEDQWGLVTRRQLEALGIRPATLARLLADGTIERVTHGVYRVRGAGEPDHVGLRAAWLALDPALPVWRRLDDRDVALVSHASAADLYGVGDLRADVHEFTLPARRQTRRADVRLHRGRVPDEDRVVLRGLPTTRAGRMIGDLLADHVDPESVARITAEAIDRVLDYPRVIAERIAPFAARFELRRGDGVGLLDELLTVAGHRSRHAIIEEARAA